MNVTTVLEGTFSPDAQTRNNAEQQLRQAEQQDFSGYLSTLATELANDQASSNVRFAAGLALKNALTFRDQARSQEVKDKWIQQMPPDVKANIKSLVTKTLSAQDTRAGQAAAQVIATIAAIELPHNLWPELMPTLVEGVSSGSDTQKQASVTAIGYICEWSEGDLREVLTQHSNAILTALVQGARKEETNNDVRNAAITALSDSMEFVRSNFENEGERNYIMQVVCEATQAPDSRIQQGAWGCLNRIMSIYYDKMRFYMEKALFGLTIQGMNSEDEDVAKLAVEFWCTVCDQEIEIEEDNSAARNENSADLRQYFGFAKIATMEVVPVILHLLSKQDEDATEDEYNTARAAYQCLQLWALCSRNTVLSPVLTYVEKNLRSEDWHNRNAAVEAFGAIVEGPTSDMLDPLIRQALPVIIGMMEDPNVMIKDSTAFALGRICSFSPESIDPSQHLQPLITALFNGLTSHPRIASSCCWALTALAEQFGSDLTAQTNPLTPHFEASLSALLQVTERNDTDNNLRTAAYEVLGTFVAHAANDSLKLVADLSNVILERLEKTIPLAGQVVSIEDKMVLEEMQTSLSSVLANIVQRLDSEIAPQADRIMQVCLSLLNVVPPKSTVPEGVFTIVSALANGLQEGFLKYMEAFAPFLFKGLENHDEPNLCSMSIGIVSDITRALEDKIQPWCDDLMNRLLSCLSSQALGQQFKPAVLQCFGDIAQAINGGFETYLTVVVHVLQQASSVKLSVDAPFDQQEYVISLREGIMDAWDGIIIAMTQSNKNQVLAPMVEPVFAFIQQIAQEPARSESLCRTCMGVVGDLSRAFPNGELANLFRQDWLTAMVKEIKTNKDFSPRTQDTARWAREQIKMQTGGSMGQLQT